MTKISKEEIEHIGQLSRIKLDSSDVDNYDQELTPILDYVEELESAPTENLQSISQISGLENISRTDEIQESLLVEKVLQNAPEKQNNFIKVKKVFE
ncbi:MAG: Asp-tRNA(Asn)/Glu-tRNA(Gln) amidotransferase subunit GatC [Patescibacteria group bacterium]